MDGKGIQFGGGKAKAKLQSHRRLSGQRQHLTAVSRPAGPREKQLWAFRSVSQALAYRGVCGEPRHEQRHWGPVLTTLGWPEGSILHRGDGADTVLLSRH